MVAAAAVVGRVSAAQHCDLEPQEGVCGPVRTPPYPVSTDENLIKQPRPPAAGKSSSPRSILSSENQAFLCLVSFFWLKHHHTGQREPRGGPRRVTPHHISPRCQTLAFPRVTTILFWSFVPALFHCFTTQAEILNLCGSLLSVFIMFLLSMWCCRQL